MSYSLISHEGLVALVKSGVINADLDNINGTSIDITLGDIIMIEDIDSPVRHVDLVDKETPPMITYNLLDHGYAMSTGEFILATTRETFNLPNNISAEYKLKSSLARSGLQHLLAGWCDPGWSNSKLTLELTNTLRKHKLVLRSGMKIGQMVFWKSDPVPDKASYSVTGQYNDQDTVTGSKGLR